MPIVATKTKIEKIAIQAIRCDSDIEKDEKLSLSEVEFVDELSTFLVALSLPSADIYSEYDESIFNNKLFFLINNIRAEMLDLPDIVQYLEWTNRSSCALVQDFGGQMISAGERAGLDGQKAVCLDPPELAPPVHHCVVYSFGIKDEWSFEEAMAKYGCRVFAFVPNGQQQQHNRTTDVIQFFHWTLGSKSLINNDTGLPTKTLDEIYRDLVGLRGDDVAIDYLKMDVKWAEWHVLSQILQSGMLDKVRQLAVKIHLPFTASFSDADQGLDEFRRLFSIIRSVETYGMVRFDSKRNIYFQHEISFLNYTDPMAYELAWYNIRFLYRSLSF